MRNCVTPEIKTVIEREIYEHEVLLSFINDDDAANFCDWWHLCGNELFNNYLDEENK